MKKRWLALVFVCAGFVSLRAATVSILVIETGLPPESGSTPSASVWETGMMDAFFDAGHIVSNAPSMQIAEGPVSGGMTSQPPEVGREFEEARIGGADFFVLIFLTYSLDNPDSPGEVCIRVFSVSTGNVLYETTSVVRSGGNTDGELVNVKQNAEKVIPRLVLRG